MTQGPLTYFQSRRLSITQVTRQQLRHATTSMEFKIILSKGAKFRPPVTGIYYQLLNLSPWTSLVDGLVKLLIYFSSI